jgi:FixJ family two-component response regulator
LIEHLRSVAADTRIVVLSMHDGEPYVSEALRRGASGYVTKGVAPEELVAGLRAVMQGECFLSSDLRKRRAERPSESRDPIHRLTAREREVFLLLAAGRAPKQVAGELGIGQKTVYIHRASLMDGLLVLVPSLAILMVLSSHAAPQPQFARVLSLAPVLFFAFRHGWRGASLSMLISSLGMTLMDHISGHGIPSAPGELFLAVAGTGALMLGSATDALRRAARCGRPRRPR